MSMVHVQINMSNQVFTSANVSIVFHSDPCLRRICASLEFKLRQTSFHNDSYLVHSYKRLKNYLCLPVRSALNEWAVIGTWAIEYSSGVAILILNLCI